MRTQRFMGPWLRYTRYDFWSFIGEEADSLQACNPQRMKTEPGQPAVAHKKAVWPDEALELEVMSRSFRAPSTRTWVAPSCVAPQQVSCLHLHLSEIAQLHAMLCRQETDVCWYQGPVSVDLRREHLEKALPVGALGALV